MTHFHFHDPYQPLDSPVHRLDPRVKLVLALGFILTATLLPAGAWLSYALMGAAAWTGAHLSGLGIRRVLRRSMLALPFVLAALPVIFTAPGPSWFTFPLGPWQVSVRGEGVIRFLSVLLKSWLSMQIAVILVGTTAFPDLLTAMRAIGVPRFLVMTFGLMWRYLFLLVDEALRMLRAREARSVAPEIPGRRVGGTLAWRARVTGQMVGTLFLRTLERGERIYMAMVARGYDGEVRMLSMPSLSYRDLAPLIGGLLVLLGALLLGWMF
ncbi:Nickel transport protein NikQ [Candidatus Thermoflexus japonica]|uniref:Nickel transport protein NikQ n=1 Tax=Candidatus Thermoflexus japonica TaxID=2035417 RepID=A0A2H5Y4D2_9CHLR|nr:Nickel transport protein NikQ [Candidatus Thermoflexus japonica]